MNYAKSVIVGLRIHRQFSQKDETTLQKLVDKLLHCINKYSEYTNVAIAIDISDIDLLSRVEEVVSKTKYSSRVILVRVYEWGQYVIPLNTLLLKAHQLGHSRILYASLEVELSVEMFCKMLDYMDSHDDVLCVGKALNGHQIFPGESPVFSGLTFPWNTCAMWDVQKLGHSGFLMISDGIVKDVEAGIEEATVAMLLSTLHKDWKCALLIEEHEWQLEDGKWVNCGGWSIDLTDKERRKYHEWKMSSKLKRSEAQLRNLNLLTENIRVNHLLIKF